MKTKRDLLLANRINSTTPIPSNCGTNHASRPDSTGYDAKVYKISYMCDTLCCVEYRVVWRVIMTDRDGCHVLVKHKH